MFFTENKNTLIYSYILFASYLISVNIIIDEGYEGQWAAPFEEFFNSIFSRDFIGFKLSELSRFLDWVICNLNYVATINAFAFHSCPDIGWLYEQLSLTNSTNSLYVGRIGESFINLFRDFPYLLSRIIIVQN